MSNYNNPSNAASPAQRFLVTGAASGIGKAVADTLHRAGAAVIGLDRVASEHHYSVLATDLSDPAQIAATVSNIPGNFTGLCNAAGVPGTTSSDTVLRVNFLGLRELTLAMLDRLHDGSSVVSIASQAGYQVPQNTGLANTVLSEPDWDKIEGLLLADERFITDPYGFTKHFVHQATVYWAAEHLGRGIRFTSVSPGPVNTQLSGQFRQQMGASKYDSAIRGVGRPGEPDDIADATSFLLSDKSRWVNGIDLAVDGGLSAVRNTSTTFSQSK